MAIIQQKTESKAEDKVPEVKIETSSPLITVALVKPRLSEKASRLSQISKYVFEIAPGANKILVKQAVEKVYKVKVLQVNIINTAGKRRTFASRAGRTARIRKAIVSLKAGEKISGMEASV